MRGEGKLASPGCLLQLDVGNSSAKWRLLRGDAVLARGKYIVDEPDSTDRLLACADVLDEIWIASVCAPAAEERLVALLEERWGVSPWLASSEAETGGLRNSYAEPSRMGVDRWLAMLAARHRVGGRVCVVDAGSALTIDFIAADGRHEGGYIIPGPGLMERALLLDTDRVRFAEEVGYGLAPGKSTAEAVRHGIAIAQAGALQVALGQLTGESAALLFCGGGGEALMSLAGCGGEFVPDLVFEGLQIMHGLTIHTGYG